MWEVEKGIMIYIYLLIICIGEYQGLWLPYGMFTVVHQQRGNVSSVFSIYSEAKSSSELLEIADDSLD